MMMMIGVLGRVDCKDHFALHQDEKKKTAGAENDEGDYDWDELESGKFCRGAGTYHTPFEQHQGIFTVQWGGYPLHCLSRRPPRSIS